MSPDPSLIDFTLHYGECAGYCTTTLRVDGSRLEFVRINTDPREPELTYAGSLDDSMTSRLSQALDGIDPDELEAVYGKPDSRDEGVATLRLRVDSKVSEHRYSAADPPTGFEDLHVLLTRIIHAWVDGEPVSGVAFDSMRDS